jgi:hypothetical protein
MANPGEALSVEADLDVTIDGEKCRVWSEGNRVVLDAPSLAAARTLLSGVEALPVGQARIARELTDADLAVDVRVRHATVARLGAGVEPSSLAALAGFDADVSLWGVAVACWRALG